MDPVTHVKAGKNTVHMQRLETTSLTSGRPLSEATDILETDFEDDSSEFEEEYSTNDSFETNDRRQSQTTISSYDEAQTPKSDQSEKPFETQIKPVEGPRGPHLFRSSQVSYDSTFDYALQMSPLLPKQPPARTETAFSEQTVTPVLRPLEDELSIAAALTESASFSDHVENMVRSWTTGVVIDWMCAYSIDSSVIECFERHDVDGAVLLDLQFDDLRDLDIQSFGKRHQIWAAICDLKGEEQPRISPQPTPFQDTSRPCTTQPRRSPSRGQHACETPIDGDCTPIEAVAGKKRRGRKPKHVDVILPAESVSIVAIEQLLPKPHKCAKGERCSKWRKQQRDLQQLHEENGIGRFPISPTKGGRVFVHGDPGNATTAENMILNVRKQPAEPLRPTSDVVPSVVASSDLLGPGQLPDFVLHADVLDQVDSRDPQDNVRQFLTFQHIQSPCPPLDDAPLSPTPDTPPYEQDYIPRPGTVPLFPQQHHQAFPSLQAQRRMPALHQQLRHLPRLDIPRASTAAPDLHAATMSSATSVCRSACASPARIYRLGTPASEMDVPVTALPIDPTGRRDASHSVPPNMHFRQPLNRSHSRAADWRRPSMALPAVHEHEILSPASAAARPSLSSHASYDGQTSLHAHVPSTARDPAHHSPETKEFGYGAACTHAGWMKKRKTKLLRHEWQDAHFRLAGTQLGVYPNARLSSAAKETIDVDHYAVACSSVASTNKLSAAMKAFNIRSPADYSAAKKGASDSTAFAFQLVPAARERTLVANGKTHHFAVKNKDERIDWMRELMLAKALVNKGKGFEVEVNGVQA